MTTNSVAQPNRGDGESRQRSVLHTVSAVDAVYQEIRSMLLLEEHLQAGDSVKESILAANLATSRNTVRTALMRLSIEGLLVHQANLGWTVPQFSEADRQALTDFRTAIESEAAYITVSGDLGPTDDVQARLEEMRTSDANLDWRERLALDFDFHSALVDSSRSPYLMEHYRKVGDLNHLMLRQFEHWGMQYDHDVWVRSHVVLLDAFRGSDPIAATEAIRMHIRGVFHRTAS